MDAAVYPSILGIQEAVCGAFNCRAIDMVSDRRGRAVARPRQIAMFLARDLTRHSLPVIGRHFGNRDHTTVMHAIKVIEAMCLSDPAFKLEVDLIRVRLSEKK